MEPVAIDISTANAQQLYNECVRLGIRQGRSVPATQLRIQLRLYARRQKIYAYELEKWTLFAQLLGLEVADGAKPRAVEVLTYDYLYERLVTEGYVSCNLTGKLLNDSHDDTPFYVTGRLSAEMVSVACPRTCDPGLHQGHEDSCAVWHAAGCIFPDVAEANLARLQWEMDHPRDEIS